MIEANQQYPLDIIFRLINSESDEYIDPTKYSVSLPLYTTGRVNTKIVLTPLLSSTLYGRQTFYYNRLTLNELGVISLKKTNEQYLFDLLGQLNSKSMFYISTKNLSGAKNNEEIGEILPSQIVNRKVPPFGAGPDTFMKLEATNNSYIVVGSTSLRLTKE